MNQTCFGNQIPQRIAIFRALSGLGDFLCIVPALRSLRASFPQAEITLIGLAQTKALARRFSHYIDRWTDFPGYPGLPEQAAQIHHFPAFLQQIQSQPLDLTLQFHGSGLLTNSLALLFGARHNAGFFIPGQYCPNPSTFLPYVESESEIRRYLRLLSFLGIPAQGDQLEFPLTPQDWQSLWEIPALQALADRDYVCVHPGASIAERRWSPEGFAIVADAVADAGLQVVLTGSQAEVPLTKQVARKMRSPSLNLAGSTHLGTLAALLSRAKLLICNDTGISHLAAALRVPSVVVFSSSDPQRWAPLDRDRHRVVCTDIGITTSRVITEATHLLQTSPIYQMA